MTNCNPKNKIVCESNLGFEEDLADEIANEVDVIINSAANTSFDERYDVAIDVSTRGTCRLVRFAKKTQALLATYVNGQRQGRIMEKPLCFGDCIARENPTVSGSTALDIENEVKLALNSKEDFQENEVAQKMKDLGLERMMDPIVLCYGKGQLTGFLADPSGVLDVVPADMVVNATLAAIAWHGTEQKSDINVYRPDCFIRCQSTCFPRPGYIALRTLQFLSIYGLKWPTNPCSINEALQLHGRLLCSSMERCHSAKSDRKLSQKHENICRKSLEQAKYLANIYEPYTFYGGGFDNSNTQKLMERMSENEKGGFGFDVGSIDWRDYITNVHIPGLRRHVMKGR